MDSPGAEPFDSFSRRYPLHILVIEKDLLNQYVLTNLLTPLGYSVCTLQNMEEAIWEVRRSFFDLILIEIQLLNRENFSLAQLSATEIPIVAVGSIGRLSDYQ